MQSALTNRLTATVFQYVDVQGIADEAVTALAAQGLPPADGDRLSTLTPTLASAVTGFVHDKIAELVASPQFASALEPGDPSGAPAGGRGPVGRQQDASSSVATPCTWTSRRSSTWPSSG